jgi:exodeoxyribonuclease VII large subunit
VISRIIRVGTLATYLKDLIDSDEVLQDMWVEGEVSSFTVAASGHAYFAIKDDQSAIDCVMWKMARARQSFQPRVGDKIVVHGAATVYERTSRLQIRADVLYPAGAGILQLQLEQLRQKLEAEGLFDESRKRPLPQFPRRIGVVTSPTGAVWHDIQRVLQRRYPLAELILAPAVVQGDTAAETVIAALAQLQEHGAEVIIVARGGGSAEDLWAFNDERIVRAVFASSVPVVSAIGHETDITLIDYVADLRAPTPSVAAELVAPDLSNAGQYLDELFAQMLASTHRSVQRRVDTLAHLQFRLGLVSPAAQLVAMKSSLDAQSARLQATVARSIERRQSRVDQYSALLHAFDPASLLQRGYAWVSQDATGQAVRSAVHLQAGQHLDLTWADGTARTTVDRVSPLTSIKTGSSDDH